MKKKNFGLCFKLKFNTRTSARFIHNGGLENKKLGAENSRPAQQPGEILASALALAIAARPTLNQSNGKSQSTN
jgi:hypothetical protein